MDNEDDLELKVRVALLGIHMGEPEAVGRYKAASAQLALTRLRNMISNKVSFDTDLTPDGR